MKRFIQIPQINLQYKYLIYSYCLTRLPTLKTNVIHDLLMRWLFFVLSWFINEIFTQPLKNPQNDFCPNSRYENVITRQVEKSSLVKRQKKLLLRGVVPGTPCRSLDYWAILISGALQISVLRLLLFNICLNDLFFCLQDNDICNFADDTSTFVCDETLESVLDKLEGTL